MEFKETLLRTLRADAGFVLTQSADVVVLERVFTPEVCLADGEPADAWREMTMEEASALMEAQRLELEKQRAAREKEEKRAALEAQLKALDDEQD